MKTWIVPICDEGQVTLPVEVRRMLAVEDTNRVRFTVRDDGIVELRNPAFTLEEVFGSVAPLRNETVDLDREIEAAITTGML